MPSAQPPAQLALCIALCMAALLALGTATAGDLFPDADPAPTPSIVEPRTPVSQATTPGTASATFEISAPGSYYLTGNLFGQGSGAGILISASHVTLDLMGFNLLGGEPSLDGIVAEGDALADITIFNGTLRGWDGGGIDIANVSGGRIEGVQVSDSGGVGIAAGDRFLVTGCTVQRSGMEGITMGEGSQATRCRALSNLRPGFALGPSSSATLCIASGNLRGFDLGEQGRLSRSVAHGNGIVGIQTGDGCMVADCAAVNNAGAGIGLLGSGGVAARNLVRGRGMDSTQPGIVVGTMTQGNRVEDNTISTGFGGLSLGGSHSIAIRNFSSGNVTSDFLFGTDTTRGEVLDFAPSGAGVIDEVNSNQWNNVRH